jgi:hypothetical protein
MLLDSITCKRSGEEALACLYKNLSVVKGYVPLAESSIWMASDVRLPSSLQRAPVDIDWASKWCQPRSSRR